MQRPRQLRHRAGLSCRSLLQRVRSFLQSPVWTQKVTREIGRWFALVSGCVAWGLGIDLTVKSDLGVAPWEVFQVAVSRLSGISLGHTGQIIGLILVVLTYVLARIKPRLGTVMVLFFVGSFIDLWYPYVPEFESLGLRIVTLLAGIVIIGFATGLYLRADLGAGPRDAAMFAICKLTGKSVRVSRTLLEVTVLVTGTVLGGPIGAGTLIYALSIGPVVQFFLRLLGVRPQSSWQGSSHT